MKLRFIRFFLVFTIIKHYIIMEKVKNTAGRMPKNTGKISPFHEIITVSGSFTL